jgi:hypothetical protein
MNHGIVGSFSKEILYLKKLINTEETKKEEFKNQLESLRTRIEEFVKTHFFNAFPVALSFLDYVYKPFDFETAYQWEMELFKKFYEKEFIVESAEVLEIQEIISQRVNSHNMQSLMDRMTQLNV